MQGSCAQPRSNRRPGETRLFLAVVFPPWGELPQNSLRKYAIDAIICCVLEAPKKSLRSKPGRRPPSPDPFRAADFIAAHQVFRFEEFLEAHVASGASPATTDSLLRYYVGTNRLLNLRRGLYANSDDPDPFLVASQLSRDAVLAYEGALAFHGMSPLLGSLSFLTTERARRFVFDETIYQPVRVPTAVSHRPDWGGNILSVERDGQMLKVTSIDRTLVDLLDRLDLSPGSDVLWDCFRCAPVDWSVMIQYAQQLGNRLLIGRLAVFLHCLGATNRVLNQLDAFAPRSACYFDKHDRTKGDAIFPRWSVIVPQSLIVHINSGATVDPFRASSRHATTSR